MGGFSRARAEVPETLLHVNDIARRVIEAAALVQQTGKPLSSFPCVPCALAVLFILHAA